MTRRFDPTRRDRIVDVAVTVIAEHGVAGTSARKIAARADVPLGSVTYHFADMDQLLHEAFTRFAAAEAERFEQRMHAAQNPAEAQAAVVESVLHDIFDTTDRLVLTHELYTLAARHAAYRTVTRTWMLRSRAALERHFDPVTARQLDALIEGLTIHRALDTEPHDAAVTVEAIAKICAPAA